MKISIGRLRRLLHEEFVRLNEIDESEEQQNNNPFLDSPEGQKWVTSLTTGANAFDEILKTKFEVMVGHLKTQRLQDAFQVASGIEAYFQQKEKEFKHKLELGHHWREGFKNFLKKYRETISSDISKKHMQKMIAPHIANQQQQTGEVDWTKELGNTSSSQPQKKN